MSKFKWKDLVQLNSKTESFASPLACICHVDVNAFFAQAEQIRLGYTKDDPIVCVQWESIIAVSYAARKYGITRMDTIHQAIKKSENKIIPVHTAVYRMGENFWQYHEGCGSWRKEKSNKLPAEIYKVSLNPYRREARKIFQIFKSWCELVEIASVDEGFLDLGKLCLQKLLFDEKVLKLNEGQLPADTLQSRFIDGKYELEEPLPPVPKSYKDLQFDGVLIGKDGDNIVDWDDVLFALGSQVTKEMRLEIQETLGYTTSCGISRTKAVCKFASNYKKPNAQTIVRNKSLETFLDCGKYELTNFWTLGGILGKELKKLLKLPEKGSIKYLRDSWPTSSKDLQEYMDKNLKEFRYTGESLSIDISKKEGLANKLFELSRGQYCMAVNPRPLVTSMMSNKNMRGETCNNIEDCSKWLNVFCNELADRLDELGQEYNKTFIPKTVHISLRNRAWVPFTKSAPLVVKGKKLTGPELKVAALKLTKELTDQLLRNEDNMIFPLRQYTTSVTNIEILDAKNNVLELFKNQKTLTDQQPQSKNTETQSNKIQRETEKKDIPKETTIHSSTVALSNLASPIPNSSPSTTSSSSELAHSNYCKHCNLQFDTRKDYNEHRDFHIAMKLSEGLNGVTQESKTLSEGEKRLLFPKSKKRSSPSLKPVKKKAKHNTNDIMDFFKK